jgi:serine/threonine protein kinase
VGGHIDPSDPDQTHHLMAPPGTLLDDRYEINGDLGLGTFGRVLCCRDLKREGEEVAVKVIRSIKRYEESAKIEFGVLLDVNKRGGRGVELCVKMLDNFIHAGHFCMVFEPLSVSLYDLIKGNDYAPLPLRLCLRIARDLVEGVGFLHEMRLIHTDLKLENVMFRGGETFFMEDYRRRKVKLPRGGGVKIIDFGGATYDNQHKGKTVNTRQYR